MGKSKTTNVLTRILTLHYGMRNIVCERRPPSDNVSRDTAGKETGQQPFSEINSNLK